MTEKDAVEIPADLMRPPIVGVYHNGEIRVFPSIEEAERAVEGIDIEGDDFAYDSERRRLKFEVSGVNVPKSRWGSCDTGWASLRPEETNPTQRVHLTETLRNWLAELDHVDIDADWVRRATLPAMLEKALALRTRPNMFVRFWRYLTAKSRA